MMHTVVDLFAGAGGAAVGLRNAGFTCLAAIEQDGAAAATLLAAGFPAVNARVEDIDGARLRAFLTWVSAPCQPYAAPGLRLGAADPRDGWPATGSSSRTCAERPSIDGRKTC